MTKRQNEPFMNWSETFEQLQSNLAFRLHSRNRLVQWICFELKLVLISEADADSGVDESTQNGSPSKPATGSAGGGSRIPKKTPPSTPNKLPSRGRDHDLRGTGRPAVRSRSVPKSFTSYGLTPVSVDDATPPIRRGKLWSLFYFLNVEGQKY